MKRTQLLWETNKLSEAEAKLHHSEQEQAKLKKEVTKLKLRLQETMEKMDQGERGYRWWDNPQIVFPLHCIRGIGMQNLTQKILL